MLLVVHYSYLPRLILLLTAAFVLCDNAQAQNPVKVFILAGESNMEGQGRVETGVGDVVGAIGGLRYQVNNDPVNYGHLLDPGGNWATRDDVWIWSTTDSDEKGDLTVGFGSSDLFGPELGFGNVLGDLYDGQILLIKTAWGGKSLAVDFRPPSSGGTVGPSYNSILSTVNNVMDNIGTEFPGYNGQGVELAGFGWHQGQNDRVNQSYNDEYEENMANFISDVRTDLGVADLPFVIGTTGMGGLGETHPRAISLWEAQLAIEDAAAYPEFEDNVAVVDTRGFWRDANQSPADQSYQWNSNGETYYLIGEGMGEAMTSLLAVPEPSTLLLSFLGFAGLVGWRRRHRLK